MEFQYFLPVNLIFGAGRLNQLGTETRKYGRKALLVTGTHSTKQTGLLDRACAILNAASIEVIVFDKVTQNPTSDLAVEGAELAKHENCDVIIGLGGGSIMDCAKAIGFICENEGEIFDYIFGIRTGTASRPLILVPTTCGTGSEGNCFAVLTNPLNQDKKSLRNYASIAKVSIIDPELMMTMPPKLLATVGYDALCHNIEAFLSRNTQPIVEIQTLYAIEMIVKSLPKLFRGGTQIEDYENLSLASTFGGMAINLAGVIAPHGMEHPASGLRDIVHGSGLAALSPVIYGELLDTVPQKFDKLSVLFGGRAKHDFRMAYESFMKELELTTSLSALGIGESDVDWMVENCFKVSVAAMEATPLKFTKEEVRQLYYQAL